MEKLLYAELNIICIVVCLLMLRNILSRHDKSGSWEQRFFTMLICANIVILLTDTANWVLAGVTTDFAFLLNYVCTVIYCILNPGICFLWLLYADFRLRQDWYGLRKRLYGYMIPALVTVVLAVASPFTGWLFTIDEMNQYGRGPFMWIMSVCSVIYLVFPVVLTAQNLSKYGVIHGKNLYGHLLMFPVLLSGALVIQLMYFGVSLIWSVTTLAILSVFISMQNADIVLDPLTGVYNRRRFDALLQLKTKGAGPDEILFLIMLDIDDFKKINDRYGHLTGDDALVQTAKILREICGNADDFIARYGGDEFIILGSRLYLEEVQQIQNLIENAAAEFNRDDINPYRLSYSMGCAVYRKGMSVQSFLTTADAEMYRAKENKKDIK